jgi:hypothetical protein
MAFPVGQRQQDVQRDGRQGQKVSRIALAAWYILTAHDTTYLRRSVSRCIV